MMANISRKGFKWDDLVLKFEWTFESDEIIAYAKQSQTLRQQHKDAILQAINNFSGKFDLDTVKEFEKQA